jgi:hypothetical protein
VEDMEDVSKVEISFIEETWGERKFRILRKIHAQGR